jgi:hypothetical protein
MAASFAAGIENIVLLIDADDFYFVFNFHCAIFLLHFGQIFGLGVRGIHRCLHFGWAHFSVCNSMPLLIRKNNGRVNSDLI